MKDKFDLYRFFLKTDILKEGDEENQMAQGQPPEQTPDQQQQQQQQSANPQATAFRGLQGQTIAGVTYTANGTSGGTLKIQVKNSYNPFTISWVNQKVTVTDLHGNTIMLSE